ncbi:MAG TPA: ion channel [Solirubrobacteraceae bacterium]|nr:ion channel [Solirubrobacteraceae bacterium]
MGILLAGAAGFSLTDHVSYGTGLYWALTTATTVGYGNVTPANTASRIVAAVVMLTTIPIVGAVFALGSGAAAVSRIRRMLGMDNHLPRRPYTIVFGTHPVVARVLDELVGTDDQAVLVAPDKPAALDPKVHFLAGDPTDEAIIRRCDLSRANRALIACTADADTLVIAVAIHTLARDLEVFALTHSSSVARALHELGVTRTLSSDELVGHTLAKSLETPQAGDLLLSLVDSTRYCLRQTPVEADLVSQPCREREPPRADSCWGLPGSSTLISGAARIPCSTPATASWFWKRCRVPSHGQASWRGGPSGSNLRSQHEPGRHGSGAPLGGTLGLGRRGAQPADAHHRQSVRHNGVGPAQESRGLRTAGQLPGRRDRHRTARARHRPVPGGCSRGL